MADSDKKSNIIPEDMLSSLPNCLILHILSFMSTKEAVKTSLLSKKWQYIWTGISNVALSLRLCPATEIAEFGVDPYRPAKIRNFVDVVGRMLTLCTGLNKFSLKIKFAESIASNIDNWMECLIRNKVKDIELSCPFSGYEFPQMLYSYSVLTSLELNCCAITPQGAIVWTSLKHLSMKEVDVSDILMENILLGCPVLEFLGLAEVYGLTRLNIVSPNLITLEIVQHDIVANVVKIYAPYVRFLKIEVCVDELGYNFKDISSTVKAELDLSHTTEFLATRAHELPQAMVCINQLFQSLQFVKEIHLGRTCIEVLSMLEIMGLKEMSGWKLPTSKLTCLTMEPYNYVGSVPGILAVLKSSPYLETLVIKGTYIDYKYKEEGEDENDEEGEDGNVEEGEDENDEEGEDVNVEEGEDGNVEEGEDENDEEGEDGNIEEVEEEADFVNRIPAMEYLSSGDLDLSLNHLKSVKISNFIEYLPFGEPLLELVQPLLASAKVLRKMDINIDKALINLSSPQETSTYLGDIGSALIISPRASSEAVVKLILSGNSVVCKYFPF